MGFQPMNFETAKSYEARAEECARLANLTADDLIQTTLLRMRQTYLRTATTLRSYAQRETLPN